MKRSPDFTKIMTECPLEHHVGFSSLGKESVVDFGSRQVQLSVRGKRILHRLLVLLPSHLKSQPTSRVSPFLPALLFSICDALQLDLADGSAKQNDTPVLPSVLSRLRDWRLLDPDYRYSPGGIHKLALDLAGITDDVPAPITSHGRLRMKWVASDSPSESQGRESSSSTAHSPSPPRSGVLDSAQECTHALLDLNKRRSDARYDSCQAGRLGTPDSEDASAVVSPRYRSMSGFRSGCSACRHIRLSGPSAPPSPQKASMPFSDVNQFDMTMVSSPRHLKPSGHHTTTRRTKREKHKPLQYVSRGAHADENEPPLPKPMGVQQGIGISFPHQHTHSPRISNAPLSREPFSPVTASVQRRLEPIHPLNRDREVDKHTSSRRVASVDLRLSMPSPNHASPNDFHPHAPTRAQSFSYTPMNSHGLGSVGSWVPKLSSNAVGSRSSKRLLSWSQNHLRHYPTTTTTSVKPTGSLPPPPAKASLQNPYPFGTRSRPSSTSIPRTVPSDLKHRDRRSVYSHKHALSVGALPSSPLIHARKWQV
jgi:hypothetical protein